DREDDRFDVVALVIEVARVVDANGPREIALVHHAVDALFDADEHAVVGERTDLARDLVARMVLVREEHPRIGLQLLQAERDALGARIDLEDLALDLLADFEELRGVLDLLGPAHLAHVNQAFDAGLELDERAVIGDRHDLAADLLARRIRLFG